MSNTIFASNQTNISTLTASDLEGGFVPCSNNSSGSGIPMTSGNFNRVNKWVSNINWDGIQFTDINGYEGKDFPVSTVADTTLDDYIYIRRGSKIYKIKSDLWFKLAFSQAYDQLPIGFKTITESIPGSFTTVLTGTNNFPVTPSGAVNYETVLDSTIVFPTSQYPGLADSGTKLQVVSRAWTHYRYTSQNSGAAQWDFDVFINGLRVVESADHYLIRSDGDDCFVGSELAADWETDGNDMEVRIVQHLSYATASANTVIGDVFEIDISRIGANINIA